MHIATAIRNVVTEKGGGGGGQCCVPFQSCFTPHGPCGLHQHKMRYLPPCVYHFEDRQRLKDLSVHERIQNGILQKWNDVEWINMAQDRDQ